MWIWLALGWIAGCIGLYCYVYATAAEAPDDKCVECRQSDCAQCPYKEQNLTSLGRRAA